METTNRVSLGTFCREYSKRNKDLSCTEVYSVTNSGGFVPSTEYFSKEVFSKDLSTYKVVRRNMFAYNPSRINVGSVSYLNCVEEAIVSPLYVVVETDENAAFIRYLDFFLHSDSALLQIRSLTSGSVRDSLKFSAFEKIKIPLPPLSVQREIVAKLDAVCDLIAKRKEQIEDLHRLAKSKFTEMFGECKSLAEIKTIGEVFTGTTPSMKDGDNYDSADFPFIKPSDLSFTIKHIFDSECHISKKAESNSRMFNPGAVLVTCIGATIGKLGIAHVRGTCNQQINFVVPNSNTDSVYLAHAIQSRKDKLVQAANATAVPILNKSEFSKFKIPLPPLPLQQKFADFVAKLDATEAGLKKSLGELEALKKSMMQAYFG